MPTNNSWNSQNPAQVAKGGTGKSSFTEVNQIIIGGTGSTTPLQQVVGGSAGYVLTSNGPTAIPSWQISPTSFTHMFSVNSTQLNGQILNNYRVPFIHVYLNDGDFDTATNEYVCPTHGLYYFTTSINLSGVPTNLTSYSILIGSATINVSELVINPFGLPTPTFNYLSFNVSGYSILNPADRIGIILNMQSASVRLEQSTFSGYLVRSV